jgi:hypothetical protein
VTPAGTVDETVAILAGIRLRDLYQQMSTAIKHPVLGHALEQITEDGGLTAFHRVVYEPFAAARRKNIRLTLREFLLDDPDAARLMRRLLGEDQYTLATRTGGPEFFQARGRVVGGLGDADPPNRQWMRWDHWGSGTPPLEPFDGMPRVLPVNFPVLRRLPDGRVVTGYPSWSTGRKRFFQNLAAGELVRRLPSGTVVPDDLLGSEVLTRVSFSRDATPIPFVGESKLQMSTTQVVQLLVTGRSPAVASVLVPAGRALEPGFRISFGIQGRAADDARWELFRRTGDPDFVDLATFEAALARDAGLASDVAVPTSPHPVVTLARADLVAVARNSPGAKEIATLAVELEHRVAQRAVRQIERMLYALDQAVDTSQIRHLCGLCDPHNLRVVTPQEHGELDAMARYLGSGQRRVENSARSGAVRARRGGPDDTIDVVPADPLREVPDDLVPPHFDHDYDAHPDIERAVNVFFGFTPDQVEPVATMFQTIDVANVLSTFEKEHGVRVTATWNHFAGCVNAAINSYGMDKSLLLQLIVNGRPL